MMMMTIMMRLCVLWLMLIVYSNAFLSKRYAISSSHHITLLNNMENMEILDTTVDTTMPINWKDRIYTISSAFNYVLYKHYAVCLF